MAPKKHTKTGPKARKPAVKASAAKNQTLGAAAKRTAPASKPKLAKVVTTTTTKTEAYYQTGIHGRSTAAIRMDEKRKAKLPGKRVSASGRVYYERRANRSDTPAERAKFN